MTLDTPLKEDFFFCPSVSSKGGKEKDGMRGKRKRKALPLAVWSDKKSREDVVLILSKDDNKLSEEQVKLG